ncbi:winged helix-turn-helix domain-containing protein [Methanolobus psychrotolerans]|uniref:winged helix-turn-helix domain-containing protein n=1 Tax=Methanolobus psychrotolerans TaxID=1874706 RepID=UPI001F5C5C14|nr:winged helix-turn-helix domain-containing protein [Methanolobus psychrotolerans]
MLTFFKWYYQIECGGITIRRSRLDITVAILKIAMNGAKKTQIVYGANLNSTIANKYLASLEEKELIEQNGNIFVTTDKGRIYRGMANELEIR